MSKLLHTTVDNVSKEDIFIVFGWDEFRNDEKYRKENRVKNSVFY